MSFQHQNASTPSDERSTLDVLACIRGLQISECITKITSLCRCNLIAKEQNDVGHDQASKVASFLHGGQTKAKHWGKTKVRGRKKGSRSGCPGDLLPKTTSEYW